MNQEYLFLKSEDANFSLIDFLKLLLPYSLLSIFFTSILLALSHWGFLAISIPYLSIIIISVITLPHAIVMHIFYNKYMRKGLARSLMLKAIQDIQNLGGDLIWCKARLVAIDFYRSLGFLKIGPIYEIDGIGPHYTMYKKL